MYFEGNCTDLQPTGYRNEMVKKISLGKYFTQLLLTELFTLFHFIYVCVCVKNYEEFTWSILGNKKQTVLALSKAKLNNPPIPLQRNEQ